MQGLFEVVAGIYQVRGVDLSNVGFQNSVNAAEQR